MKILLTLVFITSILFGANKPLSDSKKVYLENGFHWWVKKSKNDEFLREFYGYCESEFGRGWGVHLTAMAFTESTLDSKKRNKNFRKGKLHSFDCGIIQLNTKNLMNKYKGFAKTHWGACEKLKVNWKENVRLSVVEQIYWHDVYSDDYSTKAQRNKRQVHYESTKDNIIDSYNKGWRLNSIKTDYLSKYKLYEKLIKEHIGE